MSRTRTDLRMYTALALLALLMCTQMAFAQSTTATLRGRVLDESGNAFPTAEVKATNTSSGFTYSATAGSDGTYRLGGLAPGQYRIEVSGPSYKATLRDINVLVGQTIDADFRLQPDLTLFEEITVLGDTAVEMQTHQVATNVTEQQIENLPQGDRNFLNFAGLAPGVDLSTDPQRKEIKGGGQGSQATNVYIDGVSFKNDLNNGGVVGQDSSRGNPFPQSAVREFRVITQNYSAEYQKASSTIIIAVTKSGTNALSGDLFAYLQDKEFIEDDPFAAPGADKPPYKRLQWGVNAGGPIIRDRMHFFASYEANDQDRQERVTLGPLKNTPFGQQFLDREGVFTQPFREDLFFGKLSFQPTSTQIVDLSGSYRGETDIRSFGGSSTYENAENVEQKIWSTILRHQLTSSSWLNEASASYSHADWHPQPLNFDSPTLDYIGIGVFGGRGGHQNAIQGRLSFRDDLSLSALKMAGDHNVKVGVLAEFMDYQYYKNFRFQPLFRFRELENFAFPYEGVLAFGDPNMAADNQGYGLYAQDEWNVNESLLLSLGLRWDYETNMMDQEYVTPDYVRGPLTGFVSEDFFTDGNDRKTPKDNFAPRLGASYDMFKNGKTVLFAGVGRYYDRVLFNDLVDIRFKENYKETLFQFSADGSRPGTVAWNPKYMTREGLQELYQAGVGRHEVWLLDNNTEVPYSNQWNLGVRQSFAGMVGALTYANIRGYKNLQWSFAPFSMNPDGSCCNPPAAHPGVVLMSNQDEKTYYSAFYATLDRPMSGNSRYGFNLAYTFANSETAGDERGTVSFPSTGSTWTRHPTQGAEDHRLVANGMARVPWDVLLSTIFQYGSGPHLMATQITKDCCWPVNELWRENGDGKSWTSVDLRAQKDFQIGPTTFGLSLEAFNLFDGERYSCYEDFQPISGNPRLGQPNCIVSASQRRFQAGVHLGF